MKEDAKKGDGFVVSDRAMKKLLSLEKEGEEMPVTVTVSFEEVK